MVVFIAAFVFGILPNEAEFKGDGIRLGVEIASSIFTYELSNMGEDAIVGFEMREYACYNFKVPEGWGMEIGGGVFKGWAGDSNLFIGGGEKGRISLRVSSRGAVLGTAPFVVKFESGKTITIDGVWSPVREPRSYAWLVAGTALFIFVFHTVVVGLRQRRKMKSD